MKAILNLDNNNNKDKNVAANEAIDESMIDSFMAGLGDEGDQLAVLLMLPDEQFDVLSGIFLEEIEKAMNEPNEKIHMAHLMNAYGLKAGDLSTSFEEVLDKIADQSTAPLSQKKIDFLKRIIGYGQNLANEVEGVSTKILQVPVEFCNDNAKLPAYAHMGDAGADVYSTEEITLAPGEKTIIKTGLKFEIPSGYAVLVQPRSGLSAKSGLRICNTPGLIDSNYRGEVGVIIENIESPIKAIETIPITKGGRLVHEILSIEYGKSYTIERGERIAQLRLVEAPMMHFMPVAKVNEKTDRGEGAYGSSGKT